MGYWWVKVDGDDEPTVGYLDDAGTWAFCGDDRAYVETARSWLDEARVIALERLGPVEPPR